MCLTRGGLIGRWIQGKKIVVTTNRVELTRDIHAQIQDLYRVEISAVMVNKITDRVLPMVQEWQRRPLEAMYPFVFMDATFDEVVEKTREKIG